MFNNIPTFVVSLKRSLERRKYITAHLKSKNIHYKLIEAVDGKTLTQKQIKAVLSDKAKKINNRELLPAEIGCALSHIKIFKRTVNEGLSYALVLEDDAFIDDAFDADFLEAIPQSWDVLLLGYGLNNKPMPCSFWGRYKKDNFVIGKPLEIIGGTHGYIVSQQGAKKLLQLTLPIEKTIDSYTGNRNLVESFIFKKPIIKVNYAYGNFSTIYPKVVNHNKNNLISQVPKVSFFRKMARKYLDALRITLRKFLS